MSENPYMLENTSEEFERTRDVAARRHTAEARALTAPPPPAAVTDPADVEKAARELYRQWREDSGGDPADLPDWEFLNEDCPDEDEPDPRGAYRRRAVLVLAAVRPSPDSEAVDLPAWAAEESARELDRVRAWMRRDGTAGTPAYAMALERAQALRRAALGTGDREGADRG